MRRQKNVGAKRNTRTKALGSSVKFAWRTSSNRKWSKQIKPWQEVVVSLCSIRPIHAEPQLSHMEYQLSFIGIAHHALGKLLYSSFVVCSRPNQQRRCLTSNKLTDNNRFPRRCIARPSSPASATGIKWLHMKEIKELKAKMVELK